MTEKRSGRVRPQPRAHREQRLLQTIHLNAAGIDIGSARHWVAVPDDRDGQTVREFPSFTHDHPNAPARVGLRDCLSVLAGPAPATPLIPALLQSAATARESRLSRALVPHFECCVMNNVLALNT